jgi:signal recognition particle subunit SRP54
MFESLSDRFESIFTRLRKGGRLDEAAVDEVMREIRQALLEADVNFKVAREMVARIKEDLVGADLSKALSPDQQIIKRVHDELVNVLGGEGLKITYASKPPTVVLLAGLQGAGKTTNAGKLARWFKAQGRHPLLVGADLQRPAAVEQLRVLAGQVGVPMYSEPSDPVTVARNGLAEARRLGKDVLIVDTAGRLSIDEELMQQVRDISGAVTPDYTFLVIDAMIGQESVSTAEAFHNTLALDGVILTKLDGDARGGAALSVKEVVGKPIVFASTGEKLEDFDLFHPDRMAGRILGMGDVLTLIEKAEQAFDQEEAEKAAEALFAGRFTLEDFLEQMQQVKKMGPLKGIMSMMPGVPKELRDADIDDRELAKVEGMIHSMTLEERRNPDLINGSRRLRIANGAGVTTSEINLLLKQFGEVQRMMKGLPGMAGLRKKNAKKQKGGGRTTPKKKR